MTIRLFEVGGSIRDELMGIDNPPDRDFCAESPDGWEALLAWCHVNMERVFLVTPEFFTVRGRMSNGDSIDVVMCRKDGPSSDGRHPDNVEAGTLLDDLARRDFTVNAIAREVDPGTLAPMGGLIDPFNGKDDLIAGCLRCVGDTRVRFMEDGLRVLRAVRFAITKDLTIPGNIATELEDPFWWEFVEENVSIERIREELTKMFKHNTVKTIRFFANQLPVEALLMIEKSGIWFKPTMEKK
jgi:tRNA nucleotidyltransferase (CCA-adding enzyme)